MSRFSDTKPVTGPAVTGPAVTGPAVTGPAVTGPAVTGPAVTGPAVTGLNPDHHLNLDHDCETPVLSTARLSTRTAPGRGRL
jgi:hypothetical protein